MHGPEEDSQEDGSSSGDSDDDFAGLCIEQHSIPTLEDQREEILQIEEAPHLATIPEHLFSVEALHKALASDIDVRSDASLQDLSASGVVGNISGQTSSLQTTSHCLSTTMEAACMHTESVHSIMTFNEALEQSKSDCNVTHSLKEKQVEVLRHLYNGKNIVALLPTGFGKSLIYQLAPFLLRHRTEWMGTNPICIVITPLNALMHEQILKLASMGIPACGLDATAATAVTWRKHSDEEGDEAEANLSKEKFSLTKASMTNVRNGKYNILFSHPEALVSTNEGQTLMRSEVYQMNVCCVTIDEGHLVEQWGERFRTDFFKLNEVNTLFEATPHLVLTATATPTSITKMAQKLQLKDPIIVSTSPDRANIVYKKHKRLSANHPGLQLVLKPLVSELIEKGQNFPLTIVYTDRDSIQYAYRWFKHKVPDSVGYDGPISPETRRYGQFHKDYADRMKMLIIQDLAKPCPTLRIVFATVALGMGLDTRSIRRVIHFKTPTTLEQYMQETGRAGRDGLPSEAIIYYNGHDLSSEREGMTPEMREYCTSTHRCLRGLLLSHLGYIYVFDEERTACCSICENRSLLSNQ